MTKRRKIRERRMEYENDNEMTEDEVLQRLRILKF